MSASLLLMISLALTSQGKPAEQPSPDVLFRKGNLMAWCIVPFDSKKRNPVDRAKMLKDLGFTKFAYDWRDEHIPTFDQEIAELKKNGVELSAFWFPASLNPQAKRFLKHSNATRFIPNFGSRWATPHRAKIRRPKYKPLAIKSDLLQKLPGKSVAV